MNSGLCSERLWPLYWAVTPCPCHRFLVSLLCFIFLRSILKIITQNYVFIYLGSVFPCWKIRYMKAGTELCCWMLYPPSFMSCSQKVLNKYLLTRLVNWLEVGRVIPFGLSLKLLSGCKLFPGLEVSTQTLIFLDVSTWLSGCHLKLPMSKIIHYLPSSSLPVLLMPPSLTIPRHKTLVLSCSVHY